MRRTSVLLAWLLFTLAGMSANAADRVPERIGDFAGLDAEGRFHQISRYSDLDGVVILAHQQGCAASRAALEPFSTLQTHYADDFQFFVLSKDASAQSSGVPILTDTMGLLASTAALNSAGEALLVDPQNMQILFRGPVTRLAGVLETLAAGAEVPAATAASISVTEGCAMQRPQPSTGASISYVDDVAPILQERCVLCHRTGGTAPWAMTSHQMVQGWSPMIRETLVTRRMPPGQIGDDAEKFDGVHHITPDEMHTLVSWIDAGAPATGLSPDTADPLSMIEPVKSEWSLGEPDLIVEFDEQEIPATGVIDYVVLHEETGIDSPKWVTGYEFSIGDPSVVHHARIFTQAKSPDEPQEAFDFAAYAPGKASVIYPDGLAQILSPQDKFVMQIHYTPNGRVTTDKTRIGLYFTDQAPAKALVHPITVNEQIVIPPGERNYPVTASIVVDQDAYLYAMSPHMHYRGKSMTYRARFPNGEEMQLLSVPNYRFEWQINYWLKEPVFLPAGTTIITDGAFDNSPANPGNPDPTIEVRWGEQSWEEMFIGWMALAVEYDE